MGYPSTGLLLLGCAVFLSAAQATTTEILVSAPAGQIMGKKVVNDTTGIPYVTFKGIPYARPPVDDLRLRRPLKHPVFDTVFDATKDDTIACPHPSFVPVPYTKVGEDCLVLNIQMKDFSYDFQEKKKVLVYLHGGGFIVGTGYDYVPKSFVQSEGVIVVTINYRLGVLGFLSTEDDASPGNYGLWDMIMALHWVKENIQHFGGDPDDIAISGESAGGASSSLLSISPYSKNLFTKSYQQSGFATSLFARTLDPRIGSVIIGQNAGCLPKDTVGEDINTTQLMKCLREAPLSVFTAYSDFTLDHYYFVPRTDGDLIPYNPLDLLRDDIYLDSINFYKRKYFLAYNNLDSSVVRDTLGVITPETTESYKNYSMYSRLGESGATNTEVIEARDDFYTSRYIENNTILIQMLHDLYFPVPAKDFLGAVSKRHEGDAHLLYFNHFPQFLKGIFRGSPHGLDVPYWWDFSLEMLNLVLPMGIDGEMNEEDFELRRMFTSIIGAFVRTGNPADGLPTPELRSAWCNYNRAQGGEYLSFRPRPYVGFSLHRDPIEFWEDRIPAIMRENSEE